MGHEASGQIAAIAGARAIASGGAKIVPKVLFYERRFSETGGRNEANQGGFAPAEPLEGGLAYEGDIRRSHLRM
jgi:hypothetical protein